MCKTWGDPTHKAPLSAHHACILQRTDSVAADLSLSTPASPCQRDSASLSKKQRKHLLVPIYDFTTSSVLSQTPAPRSASSSGAHGTALRCSELERDHMGRHETPKAGKTATPASVFRDSSRTGPAMTPNTASTMHTLERQGRPGVCIPTQG